jgi:hypothetical protein
MRRGHDRRRGQREDMMFNNYGSKIAKWVRKNLVALIAVVISVVISLVSLYFNWNQARISSAIELSIKNLYGEIADLRNSFEPFFDKAGQVDLDTRNKVNAFIYYLDYAAQLINADRIDESYVSTALKCQMHDYYDQAYLHDRPDPLKALPSPTQIKALEKWYKQHQAMNCR